MKRTGRALFQDNSVACARIPLLVAGGCAVDSFDGERAGLNGRRGD